MDEFVKMPDLSNDFPVHTLQEWQANVETLLKGKPFDKVMFTQTYEGITLKPVYTKEDSANLVTAQEMPGIENYTRGSEALGYLQKTWEVAQEISYPTPTECNIALKHDLARGLTVIHLICDQATQQGMSPYIAKDGEVGKDGLSLSSMEDWNTLLDGIEAEKYPIFVSAGTSALAVAGMLFAFWQKKGLNAKNLRGCIGLDPLGELAKHGKLPCSLHQLYDEMAILTKWAVTAPDLRTIVVSGNPYHNAGADSASELAYLLATSAEYIFSMQSRGLDIDTIAKKMQWNISIGSNFFMEIACLRAARLLWSNLIREMGGSEESRKIYIHARGSSYNKTCYDMYSNLLRSTTESFSAVLGGCQSLHVTYFDEPIGLPNEFSRRMARNQQLILKEEAHLSQVVDPAGGSWYLEVLTTELANQAWKRFQEIAKQSGMFAMLEKGIVQKAVAQTAQLRKDNFLSRKEVLVGINMYANVQEVPKETIPLDYVSIRQNRIAATPNKTVAISLPVGQEMTGIITAYKEGANLTQVTQQVRPVAESIHVSPLTIHRLAESFEFLRNAMVQYKKKHGTGVKVFLLNMGTAEQHRARADFSKNFFEIAGLEICDNAGFNTPEEAIQSALASQAKLVVVCSTDETYPQLVPQLIPSIKKQQPSILAILAGFPKEQIDGHKQSGIDEFIHIKANPYLVLSELLKKVGVLES